MTRELFLSRLGGQTWAALREGGTVAEFHVEPAAVEGPQVGRIIKARVAKVLPGIQSAFLDIGEERGGFLHRDDLILPGDPVRTATPQGQATAAPPIQDRLKAGRDLLVQVTRESLGSKGARVTCLVTLSERLLVLAPFVGHRRVSRRIRDSAERERLEKILGELPGGDVGYVARTAAEGAGETSIRASAQALLERWPAIQRAYEDAVAPSVVLPEPDVLIRVLRDLPADGADRIVVDSPALLRRAREYLRRADPELAARVELHAGDETLFEAYGIRRELARVMRRRVWLKSGGSVVFEETEALVSIDVNTGKFLGRTDPEETVSRTNLEAAEEIGRQLRLRNLGGIIVIDFIDMESEQNRQNVIDAFEKELIRDRARTRVLGLSDLGLLQLTRQRTRPALSESVTRECPMCFGSGRLKDLKTVATEVLLRLYRLAARKSHVRAVLRAETALLEAVRQGLEDPEGAEIPIEVSYVEDGAHGAGHFELEVEHPETS